MTIDYTAIYDACTYITNHCTNRNGFRLSHSRLYDATMRALEHPAANAVTFEVHIDLVGEGYATICRDGQRYIHRDPEFAELL